MGLGVQIPHPRGIQKSIPHPQRVPMGDGVGSKPYLCPSGNSKCPHFGLWDHHIDFTNCKDHHPFSYVWEVFYGSSGKVGYLWCICVYPLVYPAFITVPSCCIE